MSSGQKTLKESLKLKGYCQAPVHSGQMAFGQGGCITLAVANTLKNKSQDDFR
jgi:hypothetical protein